MEAAIFKHVDIVELLLKSGADINAKNSVLNSRRVVALFSLCFFSLLDAAECFVVLCCVVFNFVFLLLFFVHV